MSLSIKVSNDDGKPFLPGELVPGVVELVLYNDQPIGELAINFSGRTHVLLIHEYGDMTTSRRDYKSVAYLFSQHLNLYQGKYTHRKGRYVWPFAFRVPVFASPRALSPESQDFIHPERPWRSDYHVEPHPLPPSFSHGSRFISYVEYTLHATLVRPSQTSTLSCKILSAIKTVPIQALTPESLLNPSGDWPYTTYRHNVCCKLENSSRRMLKSLLRSGFYRGQQQRLKSINVGKVELQLSVLLPKTAILKKQATLSVLVAATARAINPDGGSQQCPDSGHVRPKNLVIRSFKASLLQHIQVRAGSHRASAERRVFTRRGSCTVPLSGHLSHPPGQSEVSNQETGAAVFVNLADIEDFTIPSAVVTPDFSTYNIANSHFLDILLKMECANKRFKFRLRRIPIRVLSSDCCELDPNEIHQGQLWSDQSACEEAWIVPPPSEGADDALFEDPPPCYRA